MKTENDTSDSLATCVVTEMFDCSAGSTNDSMVLHTMLTDIIDVLNDKANNLEFLTFQNYH